MIIYTRYDAYTRYYNMRARPTWSTWCCFYTAVYCRSACGKHETCTHTLYTREPSLYDGSPQQYMAHTNILYIILDASVVWYYYIHIYIRIYIHIYVAHSNVRGKTRFFVKKKMHLRAPMPWSIYMLHVYR